MAISYLCFTVLNPYAFCFPHVTCVNLFVELWFLKTAAVTLSPTPKAFQCPPSHLIVPTLSCCSSSFLIYLRSSGDSEAQSDWESPYEPADLVWSTQTQEDLVSLSRVSLSAVPWSCAHESLESRAGQQIQDEAGSWGYPVEMFALLYICLSSPSVSLMEMLPWNAV